MNQQLEINGLDFSYGPQEILTKITFRIKKGDFVTIVGPNGSGKSTLLKNISAVLKPQGGQVLIENEDVFNIKRGVLAKKIAVVPQNTDIQFPFTVQETVLMGRMPYLKRFQGESDRDVAMGKWAMEVTGTWHLKNRPVTGISGGERQRVIVARALAQDPRVLLLDEPTAFLDLQHQLGLLELLQQLTQTGKLTVIAVLHDLNLAAQFSEHIILLHQTKIFASGKPASVLTPGNIRHVYGIEVIINPNSLTGRFNIIPVARSTPGQNSKKSSKHRVHIICGGGTGIHLMEKLVQNGCSVSCGVVNIGDSDWAKAKSLGLPLVEEAPFTEIKPATYQMNQKLIRRADIIVVLPIPFGNGNLGNLEQARDALLEGKQVILTSGQDIEERDFTGGQAGLIYREMIQNNACLATKPQDVFSILAKKGGYTNNDPTTKGN